MWRQLSILPKLWQPAMLTAKPVGNILRSFSIFSSPAHQTQNQPMVSTVLLQPTPIALSFDRGMKQMGRLKRRCKDCYFVTRQVRKFHSITIYICNFPSSRNAFTSCARPENTSKWWWWRSPKTLGSSLTRLNQSFARGKQADQVHSIVLDSNS